MSEPSYQIDPIDCSSAGIAECRKLLNIVFPKATHFTDDYLDWEYNRNPAGLAVGFNARVGEVLAGHYVTLPIRASLFGRECRGLLSLNTATHPQHQGRGLFTKLAEATYASGREAGYEFVIGVANANSTHGFVGKLGFQLVGRLSARGGIKSVAIREMNDPQFRRVWGPEHLRWRLSNPGACYGWGPAPGGRREILARGPFGIKILLGQFDGILPSGLSLPRMRTLPKIWLGVNDQTPWLRSLYFEIPQRFRSSPLHLIFKDLTGQGRNLDFNKVLFSAIDFDAF